ncbi:1065_t:CDS:2, partial [Dentiscutata erythropus]
MFILSRAIKNASFKLLNKTARISHPFGVRYRTEQTSNALKIKQLENLLSTQRKEKMVRQTFNFETVLQIAQRLTLAGKNNDIVTELISAFRINEVVKSFSSIEVEDIRQLLAVESGDLTFKDDISLKPSKLFEDVMERVFRRWNLSLESARRTIVDTYLLEAVDHAYDPKTYNIGDKLAIYPEYYITPQNVESNLTLRGSVDYISAERGEPTNVALTAGHSSPNNCVFCAVEAKKDESFAQGTGELIGQMKALHIREKKPINGVLTDGLRWMFYHLDDNIYYE